MLTDRYSDALVYAHALHRTQRRKATDIPYISHLLAVSALVIEHGGNEDQAIAALLHDAAEDQGGAETLSVIRDRFSEDVARIVADCTDAWEDPKPEWQERKVNYIESLHKKPATSLLVSLADKTHNAEAIRTDFETLGERVWDRFTGGADGSRWYYRSLVTVFSEALPGPLTTRFDRAVRAFGG